MKDLNRLQMTGRLGADPKVNRLENGSVVANFSIATDDSYKDKNDKEVTRTEWTDVVAWGGLAEIAEKHFKKGSRLLVEGTKRTKNWEDKENKKQRSTELVLDNFIFLDGKPSTNAAGTSGASARAAEPATSGAAQSDDLPF